MSLREFGDKGRFSIGYEWVEDPEGTTRGWGRLQLWVAARNLTVGYSAGNKLHEWVEAPLVPVLRWLVTSWEYLLHEERLPLCLETNSAADWRSAALARLPDNQEKLLSLLAMREAYWTRHGLGSALPEYRIPDLHFRRVGNDIELSWDDREWRSVGTGIVIQEPPGSICLPIEDVAPVLEQFVQDALTQMPVLAAPAAARDSLQRDFEALASPDRFIQRMAISTGELVRAAAEHLRQLVGGTTSLDEALRSLLRLEADDQSADRWSRLPVPVLLFRSTSPTLSTTDVTTLATVCIQNRGTASPAYMSLRERAPCPGVPLEATEDGCRRAMEIRDELGIHPRAALMDELDLEPRLLQKLGIRVVDVQLTDRRIDAACIAGEHYVPTIAVNQTPDWARKPWVRRMNLAHELCHLLFDTDGRGSVGVASNPWAPFLLERRANAFAVNFLAPEPAISAVLDRDPGGWTDSDVRTALGRLGIGATTFLRQLENLDWITTREREAWLDRLAAAR